MKKLKSRVIVGISVAALVFMGALNMYGQRGEFGLRFMPTFSKFDVQTSSGGTVSGEAKFGLGFGALLGFHFSDYIGVQGELIYSTASQQYTEVDVERNIKLKYVNLPLLLSLNTGKTKAVNFNVVVGPQIGLSAGSSITTSGGEISAPEGVLSVKKGDLGLAYGAGIDFGLNPDRSIRLGIGYRGVSGMFDISDNEKSITTDAFYVLDRSKIRTNAAYIGLSFLF